MLTRRNEPFQYALSAQQLATHGRLELYLHRNVIEKLGNLSKRTPVIANRLELRGARGFHPQLKEHSCFGFFEAALHTGSFVNDCLEIHIDLPTCEIDRGKCRVCKGKGEDTEGFPCIRCIGRGRRIEHVWETTEATCASLGTLLDLIQAVRPPYDAPPSSSPFQLFHVTSYVVEGSAPLGGEYSGLLADWLAGSSLGELQQPISNALALAYRRILPSSFANRSPSNFQVYLAPNAWFGFRCPGDGCSIHPEHGAGSRKPGEGYRFESHNVDAADQQLTLFAGLAALNDLAVTVGIGQ